MLLRAPLLTFFPYTTLFRSIAIRFCATEFDAQTAIRSGGALRFVAEQIHRAAVGGEQQIQTTVVIDVGVGGAAPHAGDRKSTRLNSSHTVISYAVFCLKKKK